MAGKVINLLLRLIVGGVFLYAGVVKVWDFRANEWASPRFFQDILNYHLTSWDAAQVMAVYLPWIEIFAGAAAILRKAYLGALTILTGLMLVFIGAISSAWYRGLDISCGCFGHENNATDFPVVLTRDGALLIALLALVWMEVRREREAQAVQQP